MKTKGRIKGVISEEPCNTGRQLEFDLLKLILIFDLVFCHCFLMFCSAERLAHGIPYFFDTIWGGPLGAPGFIISMSVGMIYTRHRTPREFVIRGVKLLFLGLLLNICRSTLPYLIGYAITGDHDKYMTDIVFETFENDILMFAGLSFILMSLLKRLNTSPPLVFAIGLVMSAIATMLNGIDFHSVAANIIAGYFIGTEDATGLVCSYFTLFNWFAILAFGYLYGNLYIHLKDKKSFHLITGIPATVLATAFLVNGTLTHKGVFGDDELSYYHIGICDIIGVIICTISMVSVSYWLSLIAPEWVKHMAGSAVRHLTVFYFIQWVLLGFIADVVLYILTGSSELRDPQIIVMAVAILLLTVALSAGYNKIKMKVVNSHE